MDVRVSVVGLGKLGLCLASCLAEKGFNTLGVDIDKRVVDEVNSGKAPFFEPGLDIQIAKHGGKNLKATTSHGEAIQNTDVTFVLVATPSNPDGSFSNRFVEAALRSLSQALSASKKSEHLFVISSTVMPTSVETRFIPILERHSGRKLNEGFSVCYDPDFVALGNVINGFLRPDLVIIGESNPRAGARIHEIHEKMCENKPAISRMSLISAEIAKVSLNAYITTKITFANALGNLCERIPGADVDAITTAIGADRRISPYYFRGGLSFGGTCFPRDTRAYVALAEKYNIEPDMIRVVDRVNNYQDEHLAEVVMREIEGIENKTIGVLGLAFTSNTPVVTESASLKLIKKLLEHGLRVVAFDPLAIGNARAILGSSTEYVDSTAACLAQAGLCVVASQAGEIKTAIENFRGNGPTVIVDCWRRLEPDKLQWPAKYVPLGRYNWPAQGEPFCFSSQGIETRGSTL